MKIISPANLHCETIATTIISPANLHCETIASSSPVTLPDELIAEVLSSLKVKSLLRFKCVNKSWNSLISDPFFVKMHLIKSSQNPHMTISLTYFRSTSEFGLHNPFMLRSLLENPSFNLFPNDNKYNLLDMFCHIIGSCNGLTCLVVPSFETEFYLWNPSTRWLSQKLASFNQDLNSLFKFSFGYDNLTDKYKAVAFRPNDVRVFTFGDNVWRNIQSFPTNPYVDTDSSNAGVYLNNSLIWFALQDIRPDYYYRMSLSVQQFVIISLDLGKETYTQFQFPQGFDQVLVAPPIVCKLMECLCFSHYSTGYNFVIWQMKEFGVEKSWIKLLKFDYQNIRVSNSYKVVSLLPLYVFENGDILVLDGNHDQLICYNWRENRVVRQATVTNSKRLRGFSVNHYVESLLESKFQQ